jgi:pSer/pThr/pTyr-binding forkhead associated (FHA) protein/CDP-diglyceride synthetase
MARIARYFIFGAIGGFLGWAAAEPINYLTPPGNPDMSYPQTVLLGALIGLFVGTALGVAEALSGVSPRDAVKSVLVGAGIGAAGGALGLAFGNAFYGPLHNLAGDRTAQALPPGVPVSTGTPMFLSFIFELTGRSIGWALFGLFIGLSQGLATESTRKMVNGAVGGFIGGGLGGFAFAILNELNHPGAIAIPVEFMRLIGLTATAGVIGFFIGLIEELAKQAWLVHLKGRNEGREFLIFKPQTVAGRDELVDVPIFGDPDVEPRHFVIKADQRRHLLQDLNTIAGTSVNGQKVQQQVLKDGDIIQVGMTRLLFRDKATRSFVSRPVDSYAALPRIPTSQHICPFCGSIKDAAGNCSCTVGAGAGPGAGGQGPEVGGWKLEVGADVGGTPFDVGGAPAPQPAPSGASGPRPPTPGPSLVGISGPYAGQVFQLDETGETTIGRQSDRKIALSGDNTVSREHARIANEGGRFVIYDMGSSNGTFVNNNRITQQPLSPGDLVQIGSTKFRYEG